MESIWIALEQRKTVVLDGAIGTQLQARGIPPGTLSEIWSVERPDVLLDIHRAYLEAGAHLMTTNTLGGNRFRLREAGLQDRAVEINRRAVEVAREAVGDAAWLGASMGPSGQLLEPYGDLPVSEVEEAYAEQARILAEAGVDLYLVETQHDIEEACGIIRACKSVSDLPVVCSFAFNARGRTMMGLTPDVAAVRACEAGADVVGANCGEGPDAIAVAIEAMAAAVGCPLIARSNAGVPRLESAHQAGADTVWDVGPAEMAEQALRFRSLGASLIGGCCGTGPEHIRHIARTLGA